MSSSVERNNPPPRRKSCEACRTAKRRCDLALPACFRCTRRNLTCQYPGLPAPHFIPEMLAVFDKTMEPEVACATQFHITPPQVPEPVVFDTEMPAEIQPLPFECQSQHGPVSVILPYNFEMTHIRLESLATLPALLASRFEYAIDILKGTPRMMVMENQTPWGHRELYSSGMPQAMQDAYACCALYIAKNPVNAPVVTTHIRSRHQELLLSPIPTSPSELLAHAQALLLYHMMHLFDPDLISANSNATLDALSISTLESAARLLFSSTHFPPPPDPDAPTAMLPTTLESTMHFWTLWVFEESCRRTILFLMYFVQISRILRGERQLKCDRKLGMIHSWYFSAHLWNAPTALEFAVAWTEREHFIVRNLNFSEVLRDAQPSDVDELGKMLLVTSQGIETVRDWFCTRGAIL